MKDPIRFEKSLKKYLEETKRLEKNVRFGRRWNDEVGSKEICFFKVSFPPSVGRKVTLSSSFHRQHAGCEFIWIYGHVKNTACSFVFLSLSWVLIAIFSWITWLRCSLACVDRRILPGQVCSACVQGRRLISPAAPCRKLMPNPHSPQIQVTQTQPKRWLNGMQVGQEVTKGEKSSFLQHFSVTCAHVTRLFVRQGRMCNDNVFFQNEISNLKIMILMRLSFLPRITNLPTH